MTEEEQALADAMANRDGWISPADAVAMIRARLNCSIGRAQALLQTICTAVPSEVRSCNGDKAKPWEKTWCVSRHDLIEWLDRQAPPQLATPPEKREHQYRYPGDALLVDEGRKLIADGMSARKAARQLAPRAEGGDIEQREERLRKLIGQ